MPDEPLTANPPSCVECGRPWLDPAERWRSFLTVDDEAAVYCLECAREEFDNG
jgi:hypothetical protein